MKFSCTTADLLQGLQMVSRAISGQQALPILQNILLQSEGKLCTLSATDLELSVVTQFPASIENEGVITIPAKALLNFAQYTTDSEVVLETVDGTQLRCTSKQSKTLLSGEASSEFPTITAVEKKTAFTLDATTLLTALNFVTFASARSSLRPVLSGVYLRTEKDKLIFVATDSYRLSEYTVNADGVGADISCIIPVKVLDELKMILGSRRPQKREEGDHGEQENVRVQIILNPQQIEFQIGHTRLISRLIEGKFPDYQQIIPKEPKLGALFGARELSTVVKRMHYFAKEANNTLTFHLSSGAVRITTPQTQIGEDEANLAVEVEGGDGKIALSSTYLLDFLGHVPGEIVQMRMTDAMHPAIFQLPEDPRLVHLIMPLRLQER